MIGAPLTAMVVFADGRPVKIEVPQAAAGAAVLSARPQPRSRATPCISGSSRNAEQPEAVSRARCDSSRLRPAADTNGAPQRVGEQNRDLVPPVDLVWEYRPKADQDVWERLNVFDDEHRGVHAGRLHRRRRTAGASSRVGGRHGEGAGPRASSTGCACGWIRTRIRPAVRRGSSTSCRTPWTRINLSTEGEQTGRLGTEQRPRGAVLRLSEPPGRSRQPEARGARRRRPHGVEARGRLLRLRKRRRHFVLDATAGRITFGDGDAGADPAGGRRDRRHGLAARRWRRRQQGRPRRRQDDGHPDRGYREGHELPRGPRAGRTKRTWRDSSSAGPARLRSRGPGGHRARLRVAGRRRSTA